MKIFVPTRGQKKTELPPEPHRQNRHNFDAGGSVSSGGEGVAVISEKTQLELLTRTPKKELRVAPDQPRTAASLTTAANSPAQTPTNTAALEPLPLELRALVRGSSSGVLPKGAVSLGTGFTPDLERYVLGFAAQYLTGDQTHALENLREACHAWQARGKAVSA